VEPLLNRLAENGVIAIILAISIAANYFLYKEVKDSNEKRIKEATETRDSIFQPLQAIQSTVEIILQKLKIK
jgi:hypothetical protein